MICRGPKETLDFASPNASCGARCARSGRRGIVTWLLRGPLVTAIICIDGSAKSVSSPICPISGTGRRCIAERFHAVLGKGRIPGLAGRASTMKLTFAMRSII